jgi:hypothetical protein
MGNDGSASTQRGGYNIRRQSRNLLLQRVEDNAFHLCSHAALDNFARGSRRGVGCKDNLIVTNFVVGIFDRNATWVYRAAAGWHAIFSLVLSVLWSGALLTKCAGKRDPGAQKSFSQWPVH